MKDTHGMSTEDILGGITVGQMVYDADGEKVGTVDAVDRVIGCMRIETNPFSEPALCIPVELIRSMDPRELFLSRTLDDLRRDYATGDRRGDDP
jgi:hypothetical protein